MKTAYMKPIFTSIIRCALILLFCYTAVSKWLAYSDFMYQLRQSPFIHSGYTMLSFVLPVTELTICGLLAWERTVEWGFAAAAVLLTLFTLYIVCMLLYAPHVPCSCGGFLSSLTWRQHIVLNSTLAVLAVAGWFMQRHADKHPPDYRYLEDASLLI